MSAIEPSGAAGASAAADAVGAQFTAPHDPHHEAGQPEPLDEIAGGLI